LYDIKEVVVVVEVVNLIAKSLHEWKIYVWCMYNVILYEIVVVVVVVL